MPGGGFASAKQAERIIKDCGGDVKGVGPRIVKHSAATSPRWGTASKTITAIDAEMVLDSARARTAASRAATSSRTAPTSISNTFRFRANNRDFTHPWTHTWPAGFSSCPRITALSPRRLGQVIQYVRNESEFPLNRYCKCVQSPKPVGLYVVVGRDEFARVVNDSQFAWFDGDERPRGDAHKVPFETVEFATFRRDYPWTLGYQAIENTNLWKPKLAYTGAAVSKAMTNRTNRVVSLFQTSANWTASQVASMNTLNGGAGGLATASDDPSSPNYLAIYKAFMEAARRINLGTNAKVKPKDLKVIFSPGQAIKAGESLRDDQLRPREPRRHAKF